MPDFSYRVGRGMKKSLSCKSRHVYGHAPQPHRRPLRGVWLGHGILRGKARNILHGFLWGVYGRFRLKADLEACSGRSRKAFKSPG